MTEPATRPRGRPRKEVQTDDVEQPVGFENRLGRLTIKSDSMAEWPNLLLLFSHLVVIRCRFDEQTKFFHYVAYSPLFEIVEQGDMAPEYEMHTDGQNIAAVKV